MKPAAFPRSWLWCVLILAIAVKLLLGPPFAGLAHLPWTSIALAAAAVAVLNPLMNKDVPISVGADIVRSLRTYAGGALLLAAYFVRSL